MSDNKFAQRMAEAVIAVIMWAAAGLGRLAGERECKEKSDGSNA